MGKKLTLLSGLFERMLLSGWFVEPTYLNGKACITINDDGDVGNRKTVISLDDINTIKVITTYHAYKYDGSLEDRRNAIKTAKDIFEFFNDLKCRRYDNVSQEVQVQHVPNIALYYFNSANAEEVVVTSTRRFPLDDFVITYDTALHQIKNDLDYFTKLIELDNQGSGKHLRWEKEVSVGKQWWRH